MRNKYINFDWLKSKFKISQKMLTITLVALSLGTILTSAVVWSIASKKDNSINMTYEQAMTSDKPFVAMFHAAWCTYCKSFEPSYRAIAKANKKDFNFVMIDIDVPAYKSVVRDYAIGGIPALYIIDPKIDNRVPIPNTIYGDPNRVQVELDRYLRIRSLMNLK